MVLAMHVLFHCVYQRIRAPSQHMIRQLLFKAQPNVVLLLLKFYFGIFLYKMELTYDTRFVNNLNKLSDFVFAQTD